MKIKQQQIKKLTRKYFIEQKAKEIGNFIGGLLIFICAIGVFTLLIYGIGYVTSKLGIDNSPDTFEGYVYLGIIPSIFLFFMIILICAIGASLRGWIKSNWKKAKARAEKEVNKR